MSQRILLATQNHDKFQLVSALLKDAGYGAYTFDYLGSVGLHDIDVEETGTILDRAEQKARQIFGLLGVNHSFRAVIGIDDGILLKGKMEETVKAFLPAILSGEFLAEGEVVQICRAFYVLTNDGRVAGVVTQIPFKYQKPKGDVPLVERSYPLSHTLTPLNLDTFVADMNKSQENTYYRQNCETELLAIGKESGLLCD